MANSALYQQLVKVVGEYIGEDKAAGAIGRQLKHCASTPETFKKEDLGKILGQVVTVSTLYLSDDTAKTTLTNLIKGMA